MKLVINKCYGGFSLSEQAMRRYVDLKGIICWISKDASIPSKTIFANESGEIWDHDLDRTDPILVKVVEELGSASWGAHAELVITDLLPGTEYIIQEYDGFERIMTPDDFDWKTAVEPPNPLGVLVDEVEVRKLKQILARLYGETRVTGDEQRDLADQLRLIIGNFIPYDDQLENHRRAAIEELAHEIEYDPDLSPSVKKILTRNNLLV